MKIITICDGGTNRSVSLARLLKEGSISGKRHDAIPLSGAYNSQRTIRMLGAWADAIIVMEPRMKREYVPKSLHHKTVVCNVGPDVYGRPSHPTLMGRCARFVLKTGL